MASVGRVAPQVANSPLFRQAVESLLNNWSALQLAVLHQTGGRDTSAKARWLIGVVSGFFADNDDLCPDEVSSFVGDIMDVEFDCFVEDGSLEELGRHLCEAFRLMASGAEEELRARIAALKAPDLSQIRDATQELEAQIPQVDESGASTSAAAANLASQLQNVGLSSSSPSTSSSAVAGPSGGSDQPSSSSSSGQVQGHDSSAASMEMDADDGWTTVVSKGKRK